ncbi:S-adenosyl-L-methionine-dependent methyltransferase [Jackrogersella minutella]|nr:S-adenosyl-L-methionine-dependent methyltransferase [Jackrogersella minutella]
MAVDAKLDTPAAKQNTTIYTPLRLAIYDFWVLGVVNTFAWGCKTTEYLVPLFRRSVGKNHLDVGAGTGYYLREARIPASTKLTIVDNEEGALEVAKQRSKRPDASAVVADILKPLPTKEKFDSVSMYYLFHCIPATMKEKCSVFSHIRHNMTPDGVLSGANVLGKGIRRDNFFAAFIRRGCLNHGVFHNREDNAYEYEHALRENFKQVDTWVVGSIFVFRAQGPKI